MVEKICDFLEKNKITCWYAKRDIPKGNSWEDEIPNVINQIKIMVLVLTEYSNISVEVFKEIRIAEKVIPIIPFKIGDFELSSRMDYRVGDLQQLQSDNTLITDDLKTLVSAINEKIETKIILGKRQINKVLYRAFIITKENDLVLWIFNGIDDIDKQKLASESMFSFTGTRLLDLSLIKDDNTEMSDGFKKLVLAAGGEPVINDLKRIEKVAIKNVFENSGSKHENINYTVNLNNLRWNPMIDTSKKIGTDATFWT